MSQNIKSIKEIPKELVKAAKIDGLPESAINGQIKVGAFVDGKLIGFASAIQLENTLRGTSVFITKKYRRQGLGTKLTYRLLGEAKKHGLEGVEFINPAREIRKMFKKENRMPRTSKIFRIFEMRRHNAKTKSFRALFRRK